MDHSSYVVTFAFVTFRAGQVAMVGQGIPVLTAIGIMAWACWSCRSSSLSLSSVEEDRESLENPSYSVDCSRVLSATAHRCSATMLTGSLRAPAGAPFMPPARLLEERRGTHVMAPESFEAIEIFVRVES
jgi:hypothetical protein